MNQNTRPTMQMVLDKIAGVTYTRLPSGTAIVCEITLHNLHRCHGIAVVVDMENDDPEMGKKVAYDKAIMPIFDIVAYEMHNLMRDTEGNIPAIANRNRELCEAHSVTYRDCPIIV